MRKKTTLAESEIEILKLIWREGRDLPSVEILDYFNTEKKRPLKKQTLNNYLTNLLKEGYIERISQDRRYLYRALLTQEEFDKKRAEDFVNEVYAGSFLNFVSALGGSAIISEEEAAEIEKLLKK